MRVLLLANAVASSVTARTRVLIQTLLNDRYEVELALTERRGHAVQLAQQAAESGMDAVVVLGGDGTLNEVANGLAGTKCALAVLPGGSTNVFARTIGTDDDPLAATTAICHAIEAGRVEVIGLGVATPGTVGGSTLAGKGRMFLFHCGIGFDADVVSRVERWSKLKRYLAHPLYMMAAIETWLLGKHRHTQMTVTHGVTHGAADTDTASPDVAGTDAASTGAAGTDDANGSSASVTSSFTIVLNTDPYTYLGPRPLSIAPAANLHNGLSVVALRSTAPKAVFAGLSGALSHTDKLNEIDTTLLYRADDLSELTVAATNRKRRPNAEHPNADHSVANRPVGYQVDGEYLGQTQRLQFAHRPRLLPVVIP